MSWLIPTYWPSFGGAGLQVDFLVQISFLLSYYPHWSFSSYLNRCAGEGKLKSLEWALQFLCLYSDSARDLPTANGSLQHPLGLSVIPLSPCRTPLYSAFWCQPGSAQTALSLCALTTSLSYPVIQVRPRILSWTRLLFSPTQPNYRMPHGAQWLVCFYFFKEFSKS